MRRVCAKFVPKVLSDQQKANREVACEGLVQYCQPFHSHPIAPTSPQQTFFTFPSQEGLEGTSFGNFGERQSYCNEMPYRHPGRRFPGAYAAWKSRWQKCIAARRSYFEEF